MSNRRRQQTNTFPIGVLVPLILVALIALAGGMTWVHYRNQMVTRGRDIRTLEREIATIHAELEGLRPRIAQLTTRTALQARLNEGFIKMDPIRRECIVRVSARADGGLRTVSNDQQMR
jgi:hypothetical protein